MGQELQPCVYILASGRNGTLYTGVTSDLIARIYQHREGITGGFAKKYSTYMLVYYEMHGEMHGEMDPAIIREKAIKRWKREYKLNLIERDNPDWRDLAVGLGFPPL